MGPLLALLITFGLMWVLLILPQQRKMRQHQAVVASLEAGDEVVTAGGVYGTITSVDQETLAVEVAPGVTLQILRSAVTQRVAPIEEATYDDDDGTGDATDDGADDRKPGERDDDEDGDDAVTSAPVTEKDEL